LISNVAPALVRKGIGALILLDPDVIEPSNLNRQYFWRGDIGLNKAETMARNLLDACTYPTHITGLPLSIEDAVDTGLELVSGDLAICGIDNNFGRVFASQYFRDRQVQVIFTAVSRDADHGYIFVQDKAGPCIGCVFPDIADDQSYPCPGTPAISDILQLVGALVVYAVDTCLMERKRDWNYRTIHLASGGWDSARMVPAREACDVCRSH
jgi:molybdopterin/thiamine biosynthesis adenylyltransferase